MSDTAPSNLLAIVDNLSKSSDAPNIAHSTQVEALSKGK